MATHSSNLAWRIPWTEEPWGHKELDMAEKLLLIISSMSFIVLVPAFRSLIYFEVCFFNMM